MSAIASTSINADAKNAPAPGRLFFLNLSAGRILSANPDGSDLKAIVNEGRKLPDGLALDVVAGHIYWTNMGNPSRNDGSIMRSDRDGKNMMIIVPPGHTFTPKQLQLEKRAVSFTGRTGKACGWCGQTWTGRKSKHSWIRARAIRVRVRIKGNGVSALRWTPTAASSIGSRRVGTLRVWVESSGPTSSFREVSRLRTEGTLRSFMTIFRSRSISTSIRFIGRSIGPTAGTHRVATR